MRTDKILAEIAKRHKIAVSENDPVLIVATICEIVAEDYKQRLKEQELIIFEKLEATIKIQRNTAHRLQLVIAILGGVALGMITNLIIRQ